MNISPEQPQHWLDFSFTLWVYLYCVYNFWMFHSEMFFMALMLTNNFPIFLFSLSVFYFYLKVQNRDCKGRELVYSLYYWLTKVFYFCIEFEFFKCLLKIDSQEHQLRISLVVGNRTKRFTQTNGGLLLLCNREGSFIEWCQQMPRLFAYFCLHIGMLEDGCCSCKHHIYIQDMTDGERVVLVVSVPYN